MIDSEFKYIFYILPNGTKVILTSRPDSYEERRVLKFIENFKPTVRFQMTDDKMVNIRAKEIPFHWHSWFPGNSLAPEVAFRCVSLLNYYCSKRDNDPVCQTIWLHCDSSSMRAPTFFGLYLMCYHKEVMEKIIAESKYTCSYKRKSCPKYYADTSMRLDPGINEMVENWHEGGEEQAHNYIANRRK